MKFIVLALLMTLAACGKKETVTLKSTPFDDSAIQNKLNDHEARIAALEALTATLNSKVTALEVGQSNNSTILNLAITNLRNELNLAISNSAATTTTNLTALVDALTVRVEALEQARTAQNAINADFEARLVALETVDPVTQDELDAQLVTLRSDLQVQINLLSSNGPALSASILAINGRIDDLTSRVTALESLLNTLVNGRTLLERITQLEQSQATSVNLSSLGGSCSTSREALLKIGGVFVGVMLETDSVALQGTRCGVEVLGLCVIGGNGNNGSSTLTVANEVFLSQIPQNTTLTTTDGSNCRFQINSSNQLVIQ